MKRFTRGVLVGLTLLGMATYGVIPVSGADIDRGKKLVDEKKCMVCHTFGEKGKKPELDFSGIGKRRKHEWLMNFLRDPKGTVPGSKHMVYKFSEEEMAAIADYLMTLK